ncbi:hypothetical protein MNBD_UNCLBAC01-401 [hydrothermal vent metagenome]|uniref:YgjP-like metallopeptidase domain-containing protein n=1 Tax=hydrothermal vent metagenome TaxID=652676 RepID=A0A3B1DQH8_9ZZZZ
MFRSPKRIFQKNCSIDFGNEQIFFTLKKSSRRQTLAITINEKAQVNVAVPFSVAEKDIQAFVYERGDWILEKLRDLQKNKALIDSKQFDHNHAFLFLGKKYKIYVIEGDVKLCRIDFDGRRWNITIPVGLKDSERRKKIRDKFMQWYRTQAQEILGGRLFHYGRILGREPKKIVVKTQKRMWGCCNYHTQTIYLNWQIILSPLNVVDYVVVHELCHLFHPNHSQKFWNKVEKILPDYKERRKWLKDNFFEMVLP